MTDAPTMTPVADVALWCVRNGISIVPVDPKTKKPFVKWKHLQSEIADEGTVLDWIDGGLTSLAVICGRASGGLLVIDFDVPRYIERFAETTGTLSDGMPVQRTGGGGYQILLRCPEPGENQKLAWEPAENEPTGRKIAVETRGEGGYAVIPPSLHPSGNRYKWIRGGLEAIPTVSQDVAEAVLAAARKLDRCPLTRQEREKLEAQAQVEYLRHQSNRNGEASIIDTFNQANNIEAVLSTYGYTKGPTGRFIRPGGKSESVSVKDGRSCHWSSNDPLNDGKVKSGMGCHDAFSVMTYYECGGDVDQAVRSVAKIMGVEYSKHPPKTALQQPDEKPEPLPDPIPLTDPDPPAFPGNIFTGWLGDAVDAVSANTETPKELAASVALGVIAITTQGKFSVLPEKNYWESTSLYLAPILTSGHRKTGTVSWFTRPLIDFERKQRAELEPQIKRAAIERRVIQAQIKALQSQLDKKMGEDSTKLIDQIAELEATLPEELIVPRYFTQDVTPEHLGTMMGLHEGRMGIISDEGGIFDLMAGRYSNDIPNLDLFLQAFTGSCVRVDRGSREPVILDHPALSMVITPQPDVAAGLASKPGFRGRGLLARFLFTMPKPTLGSRSLTSHPIPDRVQHAYTDYITRLLAIPSPKQARAEGPITLFFEDGAYALWKGYQRKIETMMQQGGKLEHFTDIGGKWPGMAARLAGLLHIADFGDGAVDHRHISDSVMERAVALADFFLEHGLVVFGHFGADRGLQIARRLWAEIEKMGKLSFSARDVWQAVKGTYRTMEEVNPGFTVLIERGWLLEPDEKDEKRGRGRPSRRYTVNPKAANFGNIENWSRGTESAKGAKCPY